MSKKVLYLSYDGLTDPLGQSQVLPYVKGLSKLGYEFTILSCDKPDRYKKLKQHIQELCDEDNIEWVSFPFQSSIPIVSKIIDKIRFKRLAFQLHKKNKYELVHCRSYVAAEIGLLLKQRYGLKFLFDMRGFWADEKIDTNAWNVKNPLFRLLYNHYKNLEKKFLQQADAITCLTAAAKKEIIRWGYLSEKQSRLHIIPCCVNTDLFHLNAITAAQQIKYRNELSINETDYVINYLGSIGTWYMLSDMLDFFKVLLIKKPTAKFLFITGDSHEHIKALAKQKDIAIEKIIVRQAQRNEVPIMLSLSAFSIYFIKPLYSKMASSPTKLGEIMSMGIPVVCNAGIGDTESIIQQFNAGILVNDFNIQSYQSAIEKLSNTEFNPNTIRSGAIESFSLNNGIHLYNDIYSKVLAHN